MARRKEPVALILAKGQSNHLTKAVIKQRQAEEIDVPFLDVVPPSYLNKKQREEFTSIAGKLLAIKIFTELDEDMLGRYVMASDQYVRMSKKLNPLLAKKEPDWDMVDRVQKLQDRAFKQCQATASTLGLSITARAKLVVPERPPEPTNRFIEKFTKSGGNNE